MKNLYLILMILSLLVSIAHIIFDLNVVFPITLGRLLSGYSFILFLSFLLLYLNKKY